MNLNNKWLILKKQSGYALIIVLLVITVFSVLGLTVISVSFNNTKQFSKETTQTQALNVAEMGLKAYNKELGTKIATVSGVTESNFKQILNDDVLPEPLNSSSDSSLNSMKGNPSYSVTHGEVNDPTDSKITVTITSQGTSGGDTQTITQTKTFKYQEIDTGDPNYTPEYKGLSLPYMDGALIMGGSNTDYLINPEKYSESQRYNIYIDPYLNMDEKVCYGAINKDKISNFESKFNEIESLFKKNTDIPSSLLQMSYSNNVPGLPTNLPSSPPSWTINDADKSKAYQTSNDDLASKIQDHYTRNVNFDRTLDVNDNTSLTFDGSVTVKGHLTISTPTTIDGDLYVTGGMDVNQPLTVNGNVYVKGGSALSVSSNTLLKGNVYIEGSLNINSTVTFGASNSNTTDGNVWVSGSLTIADNADTTVEGNLFTGGALNLSANATVHGDAYSKGSLTINGQQTNIDGNVYTGGALTIKAATVIGGNTYSKGAITVSKSVNLNGDVYTGGALTINDNTTINGNVYSTGALTVESGAETDLTGSVYTGGALSLKAETSIGGNAYSTGAMTISNNAKTNVTGNLFVGGALSIGADSVFKGNVYTSGYFGIDSTAEFWGYVFTASSMNRSSNPADMPAQQFKKTVYIKASSFITQGIILENYHPNTLDYNEGVVVNGTAGFATSGYGRINIGHQRHNGDNSGNGGGSGQAPLTIIETKTTYN